MSSLYRPLSAVSCWHGTSCGNAVTVFCGAVSVPNSLDTAALVDSSRNSLRPMCAQTWAFCLSFLGKVLKVLRAALLRLVESSLQSHHAVSRELSEVVVPVLRKDGEDTSEARPLSCMTI